MKMLVQRHFAMRNMQDVRRLIAENGWAVLMTHGQDGLLASHLPCLLDQDHDPGGAANELTIVGHLARADPQAPALIEGAEALVVFQGPHGYISADWYQTEPFVPTWNFTAVHVYGVPTVLDGEDAFGVLERTVAHFEATREVPWRLDGEPMRYARRIAGGTLAFRMRAARLEAKAKLSQDKHPQIQARVIAALDRPGPYHQPRLAEEMRHALRTSPADLRSEVR